MGRRKAIVVALLILLAGVAVWFGVARPRPTDTITTITGQRFSAAVFSRRVELARERLLLLEKEAPRIESALGIVPPTLPTIRFYDASNFPALNSLSWGVGYVNQSGWLMLCLDARTSGNTPDGLALVTVHEYVHLVTRWRAQKAGSTPPVWLWEGIAQYLSGQSQQLRADAVVPLSELGLSESRSDSGLLYAESSAVVTYIAQTFGEDRLPLLIDAYSSQQGDAILAVCGISEPELLDRLRDSLR